MTDTKGSEDESSKPHPSETKLKPSDEWISFIKGIRSSIIEADFFGTYQRMLHPTILTE